MEAARAGELDRDAPSADELRAVLDDALGTLDRDDRSGPLLRASGMAIRLELTDIGLVANVASSDERDHHLRWSFDRVEPAKLVLRMDAATANAYLQGRESLAIGIARGRVRLQGDARTALLYLPALRLICEPYRRTVSERFPHLAMA